jgi:hypothetical protein
MSDQLFFGTFLAERPWAIERTVRRDPADEGSNPTDMTGEPWFVEALEEVRTIGRSIIEAPAFKRLEHISFLGILSPVYWVLGPDELFQPWRARSCYCDGSRAEHSIYVAALAFTISHRLGLSEREKRYAVAWGLSHTSEPALSRATGMRSGDLRREMIAGSRRLLGEYSLVDAVGDTGIDADVLAGLFERRNGGRIPGKLTLLRDVVHSPLTPDTLDGIWRAGLAFGIHVPAPTATFMSFWSAGEDEITLRRGAAAGPARFWRRKSELYEEVINSTAMIAYESSWSDALEGVFGHISLIDSLKLSEEDLIQAVHRRGRRNAGRVVRYKAPHRYWVRDSATDNADIPLAAVGDFFCKGAGVASDVHER